MSDDARVSADARESGAGRAVPALLTVDGAAATGGHRNLLARGALSGELVRVRRGVYVAGADWQAAGSVARHGALAHAAVEQFPGAVLSHASAAVAWGLPLLTGPGDVVHLTEPHRGGGRRRAGVVVHGTGVPLPAPVQIGRLAVTDAATTVVDLARVSSFAAGVVAADHALRRDLCTPDGLAAAVERLGSRRGARRARAVVAFADPASESPGESLSRARIAEAGLLAPILQVRFDDRDGFIGRVDFWWPDHGLVGEFDGRVKYKVDGLDDRRRLEERVWDEKVREDRLRAVVRGVARWTWAIAYRPGEPGAHLVAAGLH